MELVQEMKEPELELGAGTELELELKGTGTGTGDGAVNAGTEYRGTGKTSVESTV